MMDTTKEFKEYMADGNHMSFDDEDDAYNLWQYCQEINDKIIAELEEKRIIQLSAISTASIGYFKDGDKIHPDYDTVALRDVTLLYRNYREALDTLNMTREALKNYLHNSYEQSAGGGDFVVATCESREKAIEALKQVV